MNKFNTDKFDEILNDAKNILRNHYREDLSTELSNCLDADIKWMHENDPAAKDEEEIKFRSTAIAIVSYRLSNILFYEIGDKRTANSLWEKSKKETQIDIHPAAKIGVPFAIDHGINTVIGETCEIGDNCLLLNNVTLGASLIGPDAGEKHRGTKRHPTIGNNVTICGNVRIFGPVNVGDNCFIGPYASITTDIPDESSVNCVAQLQIIKTGVNKQKPPPIVLSVYPPHLSNFTGSIIYIAGQGFDNNARIELIFAKKIDGEIIIHPEKYENRTFNHIKIHFENNKLTPGPWDLKIINSDGQSFTLTRCIYFNKE